MCKDKEYAEECNRAISSNPRYRQEYNPNVNTLKTNNRERMK